MERDGASDGHRLRIRPDPPMVFMADARVHAVMLCRSRPRRRARRARLRGFSQANLDHGECPTESPNSPSKRNEYPMPK
jgi:hypothetical protein